MIYLVGVAIHHGVPLAAFVFCKKYLLFDGPSLADEPTPLRWKHLSSIVCTVTRVFFVFVF